MKGKHCIPYYRVSTDDQAEKYSLRVQQKIMEDWAEKSGAIIDRHFVDDHSAKDFSRPGFIALMEYVRTHQTLIDYVLIIDWSRFSRNIAESYAVIEQLRKMNVQVTAIEQPIDESVPESVIMKAIYLAAPDAENKRRSINVIKGMRQSLRLGNWCGGMLPKGYWKDRNTGEVLPTSEGNLIGQAFIRIAQGNSIKDTKDWVNMRGLRVSFQTLSKMLRNPFYSGRIKHRLLGDEIVKGNHKPVVSEHIFSVVQNVLDGNLKGAHTEYNIQFPLKGFLSCVVCGGNFTGYQVSKKQKPDGTYREKKSKPTYYKCRCSSVSSNQVHEGFMKVLDNYTIHPDHIPSLEQKLLEGFNRANHQSREAARNATQRITLLQGRIENLDTKFIDGEIPSDVYNQNRSKWEKELREWEKIRISSKDLSNPTKFMSFSMRMLTKMPKIWQKSTITDKRLIQRMVFPEGLRYHKKNDQYLTPRINSLLLLIDSLSGSYNKKTSTTDSEMLVYSPSVVRSTAKSNPTFIEDILNWEKTVTELDHHHW